MRKSLVAIAALTCVLEFSARAATGSVPATEVAFSPSGGATDLVVKTISEARQSIRVAAYSFTSKPISEALLEAHKRGVDVRVVADKSQATARYTAVTFLANMGVPVRLDYRYASMQTSSSWWTRKRSRWGASTTQPPQATRTQRTSWCSTIRQWRNNTRRSGTDSGRSQRGWSQDTEPIHSSRATADRSDGASVSACDPCLFTVTERPQVGPCARACPSAFGE